jgi:hypothetical protein
VFWLHLQCDYGLDRRFWVEKLPEKKKKKKKTSSSNLRYEHVKFDKTGKLAASYILE